MRRHSILGAALAALTVASFSACTFSVGDPAYAFGIRNESEEPVIVRFGFSHRFLVEAGESGQAAQGIGVLEGMIEVLTPGCLLIESVPVTAQRGIVVIDRDRRTVLEATDEMPTDLLQPTDLCGP